MNGRGLVSDLTRECAESFAALLIASNRKDEPMRTADSIAWLDCRAIGCHEGMAVDARHVANLTAGGGWLCDEHEAQEVPC